MEIFYPKYFEQFRCIAGACPDSCCKEWAVDVDPEAAAFYRQLPGDLGDRLRAVLKDSEYGVQMEIEDGRCPMWRQDGLCRIQAELGHDALCQTCRDFPRLRHDYGDFVEMGLELSCPEAARLILGDGDRTRCVREIPCDEEPEYDRKFMEILLESRRQALDFLDSSPYSPAETLATLLLYGHTVQGALDSGALYDLEPEDCLAAANKYAGNADSEALLAFFRGLEILTEDWSERLRAPVVPQWKPVLVAVARYMVGRYWLQAVSDYDLVCRVKFAIAACLVIGLLGGDPIQTAQLFSKEIENDPDNVDAILDGAYSTAALSDANLLGILLAKNS